MRSDDIDIEGMTPMTERDQFGRFLPNRKASDMSELLAEWSSTQRQLGELSQASRVQAESIKQLAYGQQRQTEAIERLVSKLDTKTDGTASELRREIADLGKTLDRKTTTDVYKLGSLVIGVVSLVLVFNGVTQSNNERRADRMEKTLETVGGSLGEELKTHTSNGHPFTGIERTERNRAALENTREDLERELVRVRDRILKIETTRFTNEDFRRVEGRIDSMAEDLARLKALEEKKP